MSLVTNTILGSLAALASIMPAQVGCSPTQVAGTEDPGLAACRISGGYEYPNNAQERCTWDNWATSARVQSCMDVITLAWPNLARPEILPKVAGACGSGKTPGVWYYYGDLKLYR
jgi:hypothetical protein